jgi:hypothetical protein
MFPPCSVRAEDTSYKSALAIDLELNPWKRPKLKRCACAIGDKRSILDMACLFKVSEWMVRRAWSATSGQNSRN